MTEAELAARLHRDLNALADEAGWSATPTDGQPQGHYSDPIADALAAQGLDALADATSAQIVAVRRVALGLCLDRLAAYYAALVDIRAGEREEKLSQLRDSIPAVRASLIGRTAVGVRLPGRRYPDYGPSSGDEADADA